MNAPETPTSTTSLPDGDQRTKKQFNLLDLRGLWFTSPLTGLLTNVDECSDVEFRMFVSQFVNLEGEKLDTWTLEERRDVLNFIFDGNGPKPVFNEVA